MNDPDSARRRAEEILRQRKYRNADPPRPFRRQIRWVTDQLSALVDTVDNAVPGNRKWALALVAVVLVGLCVVVVRRVTLRAVRKRRSPQARSVNNVADVSAKRLRSEADEAAARSDYRQAVLLRFRAGLRELEERRIVDAAAAKPNAVIVTVVGEVVDNELRSELRNELPNRHRSERERGDRGPVVDALDRAAASFDAVRYGDADASRADDELSKSAWELVGEQAHGTRGTHA